MPLPSKPSRTFCSVPEWCFESVLDSIRFVAMASPPVLELTSLPVLHDLCNFLVAFASSQQHIKSPHLRGKIMEVLKSLIPKGRDMGFEHEGGNLSTLFQVCFPEPGALARCYTPNRKPRTGVTCEGRGG